MWLRSTGPAWLLRIADRPHLERDAWRGAAADARLARLTRGAHRRRRRSRAAHRAPCGARSGPDREARPARRRARPASPISPSERTALRAHRRVRILRAPTISAGHRTLLVQLAEDQRRVDPDLVRRVVDQRLLDVLDLRRLREGRTAAPDSIASAIGRASQREHASETAADQRPTRGGRVQGVFRITRPGDRGQWKDATLANAHIGDIVRVERMSDADDRADHDLARLFGRRRRRVHVPRAAHGRDRHGRAPIHPQARPHGGAEPAGDRRGRGRRGGVGRRLPGDRRRATRCCRTAHRSGAGSVPWSWRRGRSRPPIWPACGSASRARPPPPGWCCGLIAPGAIGVEIPIAPFAAIFDALARGEVDAALLIHEGRLLYRERGLHLVVDLGDWWSADGGAAAAARRERDPARARRRARGARCRRVLRASIAWALAHRDADHRRDRRRRSWR